MGKPCLSSRVFRFLGAFDVKAPVIFVSDMSQNSKTILYVDDEEVNLFLFQRMFESRYKVLTANSAEVAFKTLNDNPESIDAVISDMRMPGMDGLTFIRSARESFRNVAFYLLTAYNNNPEIEKAIEDKLILKAFTKPLDIPSITREFGE